MTEVAALVGRQSSTRDRETMSVPDQIERLERWCAEQGISVGGVYTEYDTSGRRPLEKRKGLKQAVADVENGEATMIVTAYFDRYVRSVATRAEVLQRVEAKGGKVWTLDMGQDSNATSASMLNGTIQAAIAEFYAMQIGEKVAVTMQRNIDKGIPPFPRVTPAYRKITEGERKGQLEPSEHFDVIREACLMRIAAKPASHPKIAKFLNEHGVRNWNGNPMTNSSVESLFRCPLLVGEIHFGKFQPNLNAIEKPVLTRAEWRRLQAAKATRGRMAKSDRLLARQDVLYCASCGSRMTVRSSFSKGKRYPYYVCGNPGECPKRVSVVASEVELLVSEEARRLASNVTVQESDEAEAEAARVEAELAERDLADAISTLLGMEGERTSREVLDTLTERRDRAVEQSEHLSRLHSKKMVNADRDWDKLTSEERQGVIRAVISRVAISPAPDGRHVAVANRAVVEPRTVTGK